MASAGRVLVIDDEAVVCAGISRALVRHGYEVQTARDITAALEKAQGAQYDVVLVDVALPDDSQPPAGPPRQAATGRIDAVMLVHNVRNTTSDALAATRQRLSQTGLVQAGVIENFVRA